MSPDPKSGARFVGNGCLYVLAVLAALLVVGWCSPTAEAQEPSFTGDAAWIGGGAVAWELTANALNVTEWHVGRSYDWPDPLQAPMNDYACLPICPSEWSHYVSWFALGAGMSARGHDWWQAWLLAGVWGNLVWEFGIESTYTRPSGHDVVINAASAAVGVGFVKLVEAVF